MGKNDKIRKFQKSEITEYRIYLRLSRLAKDKNNREVLAGIAHDELKHYNFWKKHSKIDVKEDKRKIAFYLTAAKIFGLSFAVKLMEMGEEDAQSAYRDFANTVPGVRLLIADEDRHEMETLKLIHDRFLQNAGSIVLGLNDALVELTGALAGLTFALQNSQLVAVSGLITGIAAAFSMGASEYMSKIAEEKSQSQAARNALYTFTVYLIVVLFLVIPFLVSGNVYMSLFFTLLIAVSIITLFSFYIAVVQQKSFKGQFMQMASLSLGVSVITFIIGMFLRNLLGIRI